MTVAVTGNIVPGPASWWPASAIEPKETPWLWWPYLPGGHLTILAGRGGAGKGLLCAALCSCITNGHPWPDQAGHKARRGRVLWVETEDDFAATMVPRLIAAEARLNDVMLLHPDKFADLRPSFFRDHDVALIVLSPLVSCLPGVKDTNRETEVRAQLENVCRIVENTNSAILGLMHLNKKVDSTTIERILGSGAFPNFCRSVLFAVSDKDGPGKRLIHEKYNLSVKGPDLLFTPTPTRGEQDQYVRLEWEAADDNVDLDAMLEKRAAGGTPNSKEPSGAVWFLRSLLTERGPTAKSEIIAEAEASGFSVGAIKMAASRSKECKKVGGTYHDPVWAWQPADWPDEDAWDD